MLGTEEELQWRLSLVTPADTFRGLFFKGLLQVVRQLGDEAVVEHCLKAGGEPQFVDFFNYSAGTMLKMSYTAARRLSTGYGSFEEALRQMGYRGTKEFLSSTGGRMLLLLVQNDPQRMFNNLPSAYGLAAAGGRCSVKQTQLHSGFFIFERNIMPPSYSEGSLLAAFESTGAKQLKVRSRQTAPLDSEYEISWR